MKSVTFDDIEFLMPSWDDMGVLASEVSRKIVESQIHFDRLIVLAKGGWMCARAVADATEIHDVASVQYEFYKGVYETHDVPELIEPLSISVEGEAVLVFDDVADTGKTLQATMAYLHQCNVKSIKIATLFYKRDSIIIPDYYARETSAWVVFPNELHETSKTLSKKWTGMGITREELQQRLKTMNLPFS